MILLIDALPPEIVDAIGAAPGIGRPSWQQFAELFQKISSPKDAIDYAVSKEVQSLPSADRFKAVVAKLKPARTARGIPEVLATPDGDRLAQVSKSKRKLEIIIDRKTTPEFAAFVLEQLPRLFQEYRAEAKTKHGD